MYAVIKSGGKQHRVIEGETLRLEKLELATGESIDFDQVLMVGEGADVKIGTPQVEGGKVSAEIIAHGREWYTEVKITGISAGRLLGDREWRIRKQAVVLETVAIHRVSGSELRYTAVRLFTPVASLFASEAPSFMPASTSEWAKTTRCSRKQKA